MGSRERKLKILLVEDNPSDATWLEHMLETSRAYPVQIIPATSLRGALDHLGRDAPHCILLDLSLPDSQGVDSVRHIVEVDPQTPIVVLTGADDQLGLDAVRAGAQDFLVKGDVSGDEVLRHVLWAVARASVMASRVHSSPAGIIGGPVAVIEAPAVTTDPDLRIVETNEAFDALVRSVGGMEGKPLTDVVEVDSVFDVFSAIRPVVQGQQSTARVAFPVIHPTGPIPRHATALRLVDDPANTAVVLVVIDDAAQT
jgi:DNA-binding NarL/FixJ family response regulator